MTSNIPTSGSTASLVSNTNTVSSTVPLNPRQTPQKDYAAALGNLQSRYGAVPAHLPPPTRKKAEESSLISSGKSTSSGTLGATDSSSTVEGAKKKRSFFHGKAQQTTLVAATLHPTLFYLPPRRERRRRRRELRENDPCYHGKANELTAVGSCLVGFIDIFFRFSISAN
ncbi:hypothetical protein BT96DRAFT_977658, partial [Gymnopus androsaceus JB14]